MTGLFKQNMLFNIQRLGRNSQRCRNFFKLSEIGRAGNRNWLKSRNSEIKFFFGNRKEKTSEFRPTSANLQKHAPLITRHSFIKTSANFTL
uniref:Candidate secreted effector n=1 Tax=Meloidogyne incognita TaxID=6306 RepID=A0A914L5B9_MELIC